MRFFGLIAAVLVMAPGIASASLSQTQVDEIVQPAIQMGSCKAIAVGVLDAQGRAVFGYGAIDSHGTKPDGQTVFEIGSITKTFTATLLAQMVLSGEVKLDEPVKDLLPADVKVPAKDGRAITLLDLATQRSALPRLPVSFDPADWTNPYADYTPQKLYADLAMIQLAQMPGEKYEYSNLGVGLLGHALSLRAGKSYENLIVDRICTPLGMSHTRITLDAAMRAKLAPGHDWVGQEAKNWDIDALAGAGAIRSTADDMLIYLAANLNLTETPLWSAMRMTHERRAGVDDHTDIGLAWHIARRTGTRWHDGGTGGYSSYAAFVPGRNVAVVVLSNSSNPIVDRLGIQLVKAELGEKIEALPTTRP